MDPQPFFTKQNNTGENTQKIDFLHSPFFKKLSILYGVYSILMKPPCLSIVDLFCFNFFGHKKIGWRWLTLFTKCVCILKKRRRRKKKKEIFLKKKLCNKGVKKP